VSVDLQKLRAFNLTIDDVRKALARQNLEVPGGRLSQSPRELTCARSGACRQ